MVIRCVALAVVTGILAAGSHVAAQGPKVVYVNFDGAELSAASIATGENATTNQSLQCVGSVPPFGEGIERHAILEKVRRAFIPYDVRITDQRPASASGSYTMVVVGPAAGLRDGPIGCRPFGSSTVPVDCGDSNPNDLVIVNAVAGDGVIPTAVSIIHEVAHSYGLEHIRAPGHFMNPVVEDDVNDGWGTTCNQLLPQSSQWCVAQHAVFCPSGGQNDDAELKAILGEAWCDGCSSPPMVVIASPESGAWLPRGETLVVRVDASDNRGIRSVALSMDGMLVAETTTSPYEFAVTELAVGTHVFSANATDDEGNETLSTAVTVIVGEMSLDPGPPPQSTLPVPSTEDEASTSTRVDPSSETGEDPPSEEISDGVSDGVLVRGNGCACRVRGVAGTFPWVLITVMAWRFRRR